MKTPNETSRLLGILAGFVLLTSLIACSTLTPVAKSDKNEKRIRTLEAELRKRQTAIDDLKERNSVLEQRLVSVKRAPAAILPRSGAPASQVRSSQTQLQAQLQTQLQAPTQTQIQAPTQAAAAPQAQPLAQPAAQVTAPTQSLSQNATDEGVRTGEQRLYSKVLESYRGHKESELQKAVQILLKTYPDSIYGDNALYLAGLLAFEANDLTHSALYMDRVLREYPNGNKAVSAMFAKAMIAKRNRNFPEAKGLLQSIRKLYPGSPEAMRSGTEEKLIELAADAGKVREG